MAHSVKAGTSQQVSTTTPAAEPPAVPAPTADAKKPEFHGFRELLSGMVAGSFGRLVASPFSVLRIRLQLQLLPKYTGIRQGLQLLFREEGVRGLFRGGLMGQLLYITWGGVQFFVYRKLQYLADAYSKRSGVHTALLPFAMGGIAGASALIITFPLDTLRTRFSVLGLGHYQLNYRSSWDAIREISRREGLAGFYKGIGPSLVEMVPLASLQFGTYEALSRLTKGPKSPWYSFLAGGISGAVAQLGVYPLDVVKKRLQLGSVPSSIPRPSYKGIWASLCLIYRLEGIRGLYRGAAVNTVKNGLASATIFAVNELMRRELGKKS
jgi:solute carrier family 25 thiamine pyrophosphate transporter 19